MMKHWVDAATGKFICSADEGWVPPVGAVEAPTAPADARDVWMDGVWSTEDREFEDLLAAVESKFTAKVQALRARLDVVMLNDGDQQQARIEGIRQEYADAVTTRQAELDALWEE